METPETGSRPAAKALPDRFGYILRGNVLVAVLRLAWPLWVAMGLQDAYSLVDLFWVSRLGTEAIAAVTLCGCLMGFVFTLAIGISTGVVAIVARMWGEGRKEKAAETVWQAIYLGIAAGAFSTALGLPLSGPALEALGAGGQVLALGTSYLQIMAAGSVAVFVTFSLNSALRGAGETFMPMLALLAGSALNIALDPLLIFGWFGFPAMGVAGSAVATVVAQALSMAIVLAAMAAGRAPLRLHLKAPMPDFSMFWRVFRIGVWGSLQMWARCVSSIVIVSLVTPFGEAVTAAYGIGMRMTMVILLPGFGVGDAAATIIGQSLGAAMPSRAVRAGYVSAGFYLLMTVAFGAVFVGAGNMVVRAFNNEPEVVIEGARYLALFGWSMPFLSLAVVLGRGLAGAGETLWPMIITAVTLLLMQVPAAMLLSASMGPEGIWLAIAFTNAVAGLGILFIYVRGGWTRKVV